MKHFKKFFSYLVALTMVLSLAAFTGVKVHADDGTTDNTLTITNNGETAHIFELYQIFTGSKKSGSNILGDVAWGASVTDDGRTHFGDAIEKAASLNNNAANAEAFAKELVAGDKASTSKKDYLVKTAYRTSTSVGPGKSYTFGKKDNNENSLPTGYYLVKDVDGSQTGSKSAYTEYICAVDGATNLATKLDVPSLEKKVKDTNDSVANSTTDWQDSADYDIGDSIPYKLTATLGTKYGDYKTYKMEFVDTLSTGLDYDSSVEYQVTVDGSDITHAFKKDYDDSTKTITWKCNDLKAYAKENNVTINAGSEIIVTYNAKLNKKAVIGSAGNPNTAYLKYSNNPNYTGEGADSPEGQTPPDKNIVFTYKTVVNKVDQDQQSLAGAAFKLEKKLPDGSYKVVKAFDAGTETKFEFTGLDDGYYKLTETKTPAGYNTIAPIEFTISATHDTDSADPQLTDLTGSVTSGEATFTVSKDAGSLTTNVVNKKGSELPSTGGMGTTLLYVAGGILVACAAAYVVLNKKRA